MDFVIEDFIKLLLAVLIGGLIGGEREFRDKAAGFRTIILICVGSALFTIFSLKMGGEDDRVRIAANIVTGIGFLGAGVILRERGHVKGLTTASAIWLSAALGMGVGGGYFLFTSVSTVIILIVLLIFPRFEKWIDIGRDTHTYRVHCRVQPEKIIELERLFRVHGLHIKSHKHVKRGDNMVSIWEVYGWPRKHDEVMKVLLADPDVKALDI